jgi:hypothetical protein
MVNCYNKDIYERITNRLNDVEAIIRGMPKKRVGEGYAYVIGKKGLDRIASKINEIECDLKDVKLEDDNRSAYNSVLTDICDLRKSVLRLETYDINKIDPVKSNY